MPEFNILKINLSPSSPYLLLKVDKFSIAGVSMGIYPKFWKASLKIPNNVQGIADLYDVSDDWIPIYDKSSIDGFYMAIGSSGNQFKNAPVAGKMMAELIEYVSKGNNHDEAPLIFKLPNLDYNLDLSFFSRKRKINKESSFSVVG